MKNRIIAIAVALFTVLALTLVAAPANAASTSRCQSFYMNQVTTCLNLTWINDGGYIRVTSLGIETTKGCNKLNVSPSRYKRTDMEMPGYQWAHGQSACTFLDGLYRKSTSSGGMIIYVATYPRINNDWDGKVYWAVVLYPQGGSQIVDQWAVPQGDCC